MLRDVLRKTLYDQRRSYPAWCLGVVLLVAMYVALWPSLEGQPSMREFLASMPEPLRNLFAMAGADMSTPVGYIQIELLSFMGPILVLLYAVGVGSSSIAGEEDRRTLDLLLTTPVTRSRVVVDKALAMVLGTLGLAVVLGVALVAERRLADMDLPAGNVAAVGTVLLLVLVAAVGFDRRDVTS